MSRMMFLSTPSQMDKNWIEKKFEQNECNDVAQIVKDKFGQVNEIEQFFKDSMFPKLTKHEAEMSVTQPTLSINIEVDFDTIQKAFAELNKPYVQESKRKLVFHKAQWEKWFTTKEREMVMWNYDVELINEDGTIIYVTNI